MAFRNSEFKKTTSTEPADLLLCEYIQHYDPQQYLRFLTKYNVLNNDIFNTCAAQGDTAVFMNVCDYVVSQNRSDLLNAPDATGATPLHYAVRFNKLGVINYLLKSLKEKADDASKWKNNQGQMPVQLLSYNDSGTTKSIVKSMLEAHMARHNLPPLSQKLDVDVVLAEYKEDCNEDPRLSGDLRHAVAMINKFPDDIKFSPTHLNGPTFPKEVNATLKTSLWQATSNMRDELYERIDVIALKFKEQVNLLENKEFNNESIQAYIKLNGERARKQIKLEHDTSKQHGMACCDEMASTFVYHSNQTNPNKYIQTYEVLNGAHAIIGMNRNIYKDSHLPSTRMVFCDPWSKTIALSRNYLKKLKYWEQYHDPDTNEHKFDLVGPINPNFHKVVAIKSLNGQPEANWTNLELLRDATQSNRKLFLQARDHEEKTKFHDTANSGDRFSNKIYFHYLRELKDDGFATTVLSMTDSSNQTALHAAINNEDPLILQIYLEEYHRYFKEKFLAILLAERNSFFYQIIESKNQIAMPILVNFFKSTANIKMDALITEFLSTKTTDTLHIPLFNLCGANLNDTEKNAHPV